MDYIPTLDGEDEIQSCSGCRGEIEIEHHLLRYGEMVFKLRLPQFALLCFYFKLHNFVIGVDERRTYLHSIVMFVVTFNSSITTFK